ncbi:MAG: hypothetical protein ACTHQ3_00920 [Motilibacteraceae bacterium]
MTVRHRLSRPASARPALRAVAAALAAGVVLAGCSSGSAGTGSGASSSSPSGSPKASDSPSASGAATPAGTPATTQAAADLLPGMPPPLNPDDVWAADTPNNLAPAVKGDLYRVYVPNTLSNTVTVIDPKTYTVVGTLPVGREPQHVVPSWDLRTLWVNNDLGNSLTPIDPRTGKAGKPVPVHDPYNLYFTPDGKSAVVMASNDRQLVFRDPHTMKVQKSVPADCAGVNHADWSADGRYFIVSCEFSGDVLKVDTAEKKVVGKIALPRTKGAHSYHAMPQDVKLSPDGKTFYIADMNSNGLWLLDGDRFKVKGFLPTGKGTHGLYVTRDSKHLLISNRDEGSVSVLDFATGKLVAKWHLPGGGSPDMGGLSPDGKVFWLSGRYNGVVYAISTVDGHLIKKIAVGKGPHGLCVWPQPGRYSLGHTGIMR